MIVDEVDHNACILAMGGLQPVTAAQRHRVMIGKVVDAPVQFDALPDPAGVPVFFSSFHVIGNEIAC